MYGAGPSCVESVVSAFKDVVQEESALLVPILGALSELQLPVARRKEVFDLSLDALNVVDEVFLYLHRFVGRAGLSYRV